MFNAERLLKWLDEHEMTQYHLAKISGLKQSTISRIISGLVDPNARTISRLCSCTGLSPNEVLIVQRHDNRDERRDCYEVTHRHVFMGNHSGERDIVFYE
jgi:transcriptional regulator with XRE-family HTH domain